MNNGKILGKHMRNFRMEVLNKTLQDVQGSAEGIKGLSAFEHGRSTNFNHMFKYVEACDTEEQIEILLETLKFVLKFYY